MSEVGWKMGVAAVLILGVFFFGFGWACGVQYGQLLSARERYKATDQTQIILDKFQQQGLKAAATSQPE